MKIKPDLSKPEDIYTKIYFCGGHGARISGYFDYRWINRNRVWNPVIEVIKDIGILPGMKILDVGGAFGFLANRLEPLFPGNVYMFDISAFALEQAKKYAPNAHLQQGDVQKPADLDCYPDNFFDVITGLDVFEHTESFGKSLKNVLRKLKKGGVIIISTPLKDTWAGFLFRLFIDRDISHVSVPHRRELFRIVRKLDLRVIKKRCFFPTPRGRFPFPVSIELVLQKI